MKLPFIDVQYVYTNDCNLASRADYCTVSKNRIQRATFSKIQEACKIFRRHNLQVKILGGNPSDEKDFERFIKWMNFLDLDYVVTDNAMNYQKLIDCEVKGAMFSLDTLGDSNIGGCSTIKSMKAKEIIPLVKDSFSYIGANVIINSLNIDEVPKIVEFLTENNAVANLCPLIVGKNDNFIYRSSDSPYSLDKLDNYYEKVKKLSGRLLEMKLGGYKIGAPEKYLEMLPNVIMKNRYSWNCSNINTIPLLRVNTDLSLMICSDLIGDVSKYSVFDIESKFDEINTSWVNDVQKKKCCENNGCYWSNIVIADIYNRKGFGTLEATRRNL
jgi:molybdenum cofactor biosynthesis enzyme MoaA